METFRNHPDNLEAKPNFYLPRDTGEVDGDGNPVIAYDVEVRQDIDPVLGVITYTRKSKLGIQQIAITASDVTLYNGTDEDNLLPVMTQNVTLETSTDGITWASEPTVDRVIDADGDGLIDYLISTGASGYLQISSIYNWFTEGSGKQTYEFACPGKLGRVKLTCTIYDAEQAIINIDDFDGPVDYTLTDDVAEWIFYPEGVADGGVVDPYIGVYDNGTSITVDFTSSEQAVWAIATENAVLVEDTPTRAVIHEDYYWWYCYPGKLIRFRHDTGASTTGMALDGGNTYCVTGNLTQVGSTEMYFYPCDANTNTNKSSIATAWLSANYPTIVDSIGSIVTDNNIPDTVDTDAGFCSDGAYHIDLDSTNHNAKLDYNQTEINSAVVLHDASVRTGDGSTEHCIFYWPCESLTAYRGPSTSDTTITGSNNSACTFTVDGPRGKCCDTVTSNDVSFAVSAEDVVKKDTGTIILDLNIQSDANTDFVWSIGDLGDYLSIQLSGGNQLDIVFYLGGTTQELTLGTYNVYPEVGEWVSVFVAWEGITTASGRIFAGLNGELLKIINTTTAWDDGSFSTMYFGARFDGGANADVLISDVRIYDKCILPYGTYLSAQHIATGNYDDANSDILFYDPLDDVDATAQKIGTGTYSWQGAPTNETGVDGNNCTLFNADTESLGIGGTGNFDPTKGKISFWMKGESSSGTGTHRFFGRDAGSAGDFFIATNNGTHYFGVRDSGNTIRYLSFISSNSFFHNWDSWHFWEFIFDSSAPVYDTFHFVVYKDKIRVAHSSAINAESTYTPGTTPTTLEIGNDASATATANAYMQHFAITDILTPQLPFVMSHGPIEIPKRYRGGTLEVPGTDYDLAVIL
jgi:hypothetical protein